MISENYIYIHENLQFRRGLGMGRILKEPGDKGTIRMWWLPNRNLVRVANRLITGFPFLHNV